MQCEHEQNKTTRGMLPTTEKASKSGVSKVKSKSFNPMLLLFFDTEKIGGGTNDLYYVDINFCK